MAVKARRRWSALYLHCSCFSIQSQPWMKDVPCLLDIAKLDRKIGKLVRLLACILDIDSIELIHRFIRIMLNESNVFVIQKEGFTLSFVKGRCRQRWNWSAFKVQKIKTTRCLWLFHYQHTILMEQAMWILYLVIVCMVYGFAIDSQSAVRRSNNTTGSWQRNNVMWFKYLCTDRSYGKYRKPNKGFKHSVQR